MATKKTPVNSKFLEVATSAVPANPAVTSADRAFIRGLKRRGFTDEEITALGRKAGLNIQPSDLAVKTRKAKAVAVVAPVAQPRPMQPAPAQPQR